MVIILFFLVKKKTNKNYIKKKVSYLFKLLNIKLKLCVFFLKKMANDTRSLAFPL